MALSAVFHSINSPDNSPFSHSVLPDFMSALLVLSTTYLFMKVSFSPDVIPSGWLGSKHQITNNCSVDCTALLSVVATVLGWCSATCRCPILSGKITTHFVPAGQRYRLYVYFLAMYFLDCKGLRSPKQNGRHALAPDIAPIKQHPWDELGCRIRRGFRTQHIHDL